MATMCFERAGDTIWEKLAKASGLRAMADQMQGTNPGSYFDHLREAAEMFESIGKLESAASCYCDLREYERAGNFMFYHKHKHVSNPCFDYKVLRFQLFCLCREDLFGEVWKD